ncbi:MAG TPA: hypothetical protein VMD30_00255 [Tepidisphaeraceae bacterium]|nr:hypothetical protein [Tepidisphaeraceae bacterium]
MGQRSWSLGSSTVHASVTRTGGHLAPVIFDRRGKKISPYSIAPWATERLPKNTLPLIAALRGDFFCLPFGGNTNSWHGEKHPVHGQTANANWKFRSLQSQSGRHTLHLSLQTTVRQGAVDKFITLIDGHNAVYCRHVISGMTGPMPLGHHAMLKFPSASGGGVISTSRFIFGQVYPGQFEDPACGGYSSLRPGVEFDSLESVLTQSGSPADLSRYPARAGFEDLAMLIADPALPFAWTAATLAAEGYVWFALKDAKILTSTVLWFSNGGRHYAPWNGRHRGVLGLEEITGHFHEGLAQSAEPNPLSDRGFVTAHQLSPGLPLTVNYIMAVAPIPKTFDAVANIEVAPAGDSVTIRSRNEQSVTAPIDMDFLTWRA